MTTQLFRQKIDNLKSTLSCIDFLNLHLPEGKSICAPSFIRTDRNPSFTVYHDHCFDWATHSQYDILDLKMLRDHQSLAEAYLDLAGEPLFSPQLAHDSNFSSSPNQPAKLLQDNISLWHQNLLNDPVITFKGKQLHLLSDYLAGRAINLETAKSMQLGFNPDTHRLIFPLFKNGRPVYFIGRDLTGNSESKYKYVKAKISENPAYESSFWGRETLRQQKDKYFKTFNDEFSGETYSVEDTNPRNFSLIICEGMLDYASFRQDGWQVITPGTIHFSSHDLPQVLSLAKSYRNVCICFDNDKAGQLAAIELGRKFFEHRIKFSVAQTHNPDGTDSKYDINDYYSHGGNLELLVSEAKNGLAFLASSFDTEDELYNFLENASRWASPVDIHKLQREILSLVRFNPDYNPDNPDESPLLPKFEKSAIKLIFRAINQPAPEKKIAQEVLDKHSILYNYNDSFYEFRAGRWQPIPDIAVFQYASDRLGLKAGAGRCRNIVTHLKGMAGQWADFDAQHVIAFKNGVLDLETGQFHKHSPEFMNTIILNYNYVPTALCRKWRRFIQQVAKNSPKLIKQLQKAAGYVLFADNSLQKMFALFGTGANGKSVFTGVLEHLYGSQNCSSVRPDRLSNEFDPMHLRGKLANICYEAKRSLNGAEETLKAVVSGDPIMAAHKGVDAEAFTSRAKWFINLNDVLETTDISWGFLRRLIFLPFNETFSGEEANPNLMNELLEELPGIFNWAYEGYKMLRQDMAFEQLEEATQLMEKMTARVNNCFTFFCESFRYDARDYLKELEQDSYPHEKTIYELYKDWCKDNNEKPETKRSFLERFRVFIQKYRPDVVISEPHHVDGIRGTVCTYYFPEIIPVNEPDFFAERRNEYGEFLPTTDTPNVQPEEIIEDMQRIDVDSAIATFTSNHDKNRLLELGKVAFEFCMKHPAEWWMSDWMTKDEWRALAAYAEANPLASDMIGFRKHFAEYLAKSGR